MPGDVLIAPISLSSLLSYITPGVLWVFFGIVVLITAIITLILIYHWVRYSIHPLRVFLVGIIYLAGLVILLGASLFFLFSITS